MVPYKTFFKKAVLLFCSTTLPCFLALAQNINVKGTVVDESGMGIIGAGVMEKGTSHGVVTDLDGNFEISVPSNATIVFSCLNYVTLELPAQEVMNVTLTEDREILDEVVVVGYGVQKKSSVTGSISQVKENDIANRTITSVQEALQGKTSGVQTVTTSGQPGSAPSIRVRGYSSNSDMSPLYVVDGILVSRIDNIDPGNIESMEILKDASSAAIYGAQAGNGVVLITTKRGRENEGWGSVTYDFQYSSQSIAHKPRMMTAAEYADYMVDAGLTSQATVDMYWDGHRSTDWFDAFFEPSDQFKHQLSFSTASDKGSVFVSAGHLTNDGIVSGDDDRFERFTVAANIDYKIKPWLRLSSTNNLNRTIRNNANVGGITNVFMMDPISPVTYKESELPPMMANALASGKKILKNADGEYYSISPFFNFANPFADKDATIAKSRAFDLNGTLSVDLSPIKGFTFTSKVGYSFSASNSQNFSQKGYRSSMQDILHNSFNQRNSDNVYYQWDNYANYMTTLGSKHDITAMVGHSFTHSLSIYTSGSLSGTDEDPLEDDPEHYGWLNYARSSATTGNGGVRTLNTSESYFARFNYAYDGKYLLQASLRADAFDLSRLPLANRWGYFPAASAAWVASGESFWNRVMPAWFNYMKVRLSWGQNGSVGALSNYLYDTSMVPGTSYAFDASGGTSYGYVTSYVPTSMGNDNLSWETSTQLDLGLDARFFNNRLGITLDWYRKVTDGLLISNLTPSLIAGGTFAPQNAGNVLNRGTELEISWRDDIGDFHYSVSANGSTLYNRVTKLPALVDYLPGITTNTGDVLTIFEEGAEVWHFYGYKFTGINSADGTAMFEDINGDGVTTTDDRTNIGSAIPKLTYGLTINAGWKNFDLLVFGSGTYGNKIYSSLFWNDRTTANRLYSDWYENRWTPSNTSGTTPAANAPIGQYLVSSAMVKDGSYFKIKQIQLGYTLPQSIAGKFSVGHLRAYVSLDDWFTFTGYTGFDPESASAGTGSGQGIDYGGYPVSRKLVLGLNITF